MSFELFNQGRAAGNRAKIRHKEKQVYPIAARPNDKKGEDWNRGYLHGYHSQTDGRLVEGQRDPRSKVSATISSHLHQLLKRLEIEGGAEERPLSALLDLGLRCHLTAQTGEPDLMDPADWGLIEKLETLRLKTIEQAAVLL